MGHFDMEEMTRPDQEQHASIFQIDGSRFQPDQ
jgi:hypothetical protein